MKNRSPVDNIRSIQHVLKNNPFSDVEASREVNALLHTEYVDELAYLLSVDRATGLQGRVSLLNYLKMQLVSHSKRDATFAFVVIEFNDFNMHLDQYGLTDSDQQLAAFADALEALKSTSQVNFAISRREFGIVIRDVKDHEVLYRTLNTYFRDLKRFMNLRQMNMDFWIGLALSGIHGSTPDQLVSSARVAVRNAKHHGNRNIVVYNEDIALNEKKLKAYAEALKTAIQNKEMYPVFQLKYSREKGTYYGAEILCRWKNPELGNVSPSIFIPIAEKTGLIMDISKFIVDEAFKAHQKIIRHYHHHFMLSINLSNRELTDRDFFNYFVEKAKEYDLAPKFIGIEITERELIDHMEVIREYHEYGVSIIVDDFGVDYSALNLLTYDFIDTVKIDKSFVTEMVSNRRTYMMLKHIVQLIGYLGLNCIIEGIETEEQLDLLQGIGIDNIQGFYFSKPSVFEDIVAQITKTAS